MLKDKNNDYNSDDDDLDGMIHQYNEDNELRRKINEMKKQKAENINVTSNDFEEDTVYIPEDDKRIPDIRVDQENEKTRVGFQDESDKTLVIMDRKPKPEPTSNQDSYTRVDMDPIHHEEPPKKPKKKEDKKDEDDMSEANKKMNKRITYIIIGVLVVALLVGIGFGVKAVFFSGEGENKEEEKTSEENKKDEPKKTTPAKKEEPDIKDNTATIAQLKSQQATYEEQLNQVLQGITTQQSEYDSAQASITHASELADKVTQLVAQKDALGAALEIKATEQEKALEEVNAIIDETCKVDEQGEKCQNARKYVNLVMNDIPFAQQENKLEQDKVPSYSTKSETASKKIDSYKEQQVDLEKKIADIVTKLATYE